MSSLRMTSTGWDLETDVLVVGAGGCGLTAALAAREVGAQVVVFEKMDGVGGTTRLSDGSIPGAGTRLQRAAGLDDSPERYAEDLLRQSGAHDMQALVPVLAAESAPLIEWLIDSLGFELHLITDFRHVGHSVNRLHALPSRTGIELIERLAAAARDRGIALHVNSPCCELLTDDEGAVIGAVIAQPGGTLRCRACKVILAAGGYAASPGLLAHYAEDIAAARYFGAPGATGEALGWCLELGAGLGNIGAYNAFATFVAPNGPALSWTVIEKGGLAVNAAGRRFGNEMVGYSGFAAAVLAQNGRVHVIADARVRDAVAEHEGKFRALLKAGHVYEHATLEALAQRCGLDAEALVGTLWQYNAQAVRQGPDEFGRTEFGLAPLQPPFVSCEIVAGLNATQGGLHVDANGRPLGSDGRVIPNLFAGGGTAAGVSGRRGGRGYASGNGLLGALVLGRIAGRAAAQEIRPTGARRPRPGVSTGEHGRSEG